MAECPICNKELNDGNCEAHGTICKDCGTLYKEEVCPTCYPSFEITSGRNHAYPGMFRLGELSIQPREFSAITGRGVTKREINILNAASSGEDPSRKKVRQKIEAAIRFLNVPHAATMTLLGNVERNSVSLANKTKMELVGSDNARTSYEKLAAYSLLTEAKKIGRTILEVQEALAKAGFNIKLQVFTLRIAIADGIDVSSVSMYVNNWKRNAESFKPRQVGVGPMGKEYTVSVQTFLSDTIDNKAMLGEESWIQVHFDNAIILPSELAVERGNYEYYVRWYSKPSEILRTRGRVMRLLQRDPSTVSIRLNAGKCFALFKAVNRLLDKTKTVTNENSQSNNSLEIESAIRQHLPVPSKKYPASASLMRMALCLDKFERRSAQLFREFLEDSTGRSQRTLAQDAMTRADEEIYSSLPLATRLAMRSYIATLPLKRKDRRYTGIQGLLIPSETTQDRSSNGIPGSDARR